MATIIKREENRKFFMFKDPDGPKKGSNKIMDQIDFDIFTKNWHSPFEEENRERFNEFYLRSGHS